MFFQNLNIIKKNRNITGEYNFSMQKSKYIPLLSSLGMNSLTNFFGHNMFNLSIGEHINNPNPYFERSLNTWSEGRELGISNYIQLTRHFEALVGELADVKYYFRAHSIREFPASHWARNLQKVSYHRLLTGKGTQKVNQVIYHMPIRSLGLIAEPDKAVDLFYAFTFKTEYLEQLQITLIKGKPFDNRWFTLFIHPDIPEIAKEGQFTKPFSRDFITPFEDKGIEIIFEDHILDSLSFREVPEEEIIIPYVFKLKTKGRNNQQIEREEALANFLSLQVSRITQQEDWDMGKIGGQIALEQLLVYKQNASIRFFGEFIEDNYYQNIPKIEGMVRKLYVGSRALVQIWNAVENIWVEEQNYLAPRNELAMYFAVGEPQESRLTPSYLSSAYISMEFSINNGGTYAYLEEFVTITDLDLFPIFYRIENYRAVMYELDNLPINEPTIKILNSGYTYNLDTSNKWYAIDSAMFQLALTSELLNRATSVHLILSSDYLSLEGQIANNNFVYFLDEDNLYLKISNFLFFINVRQSMNFFSALSGLSAKILIGEENFKSLFLDKIHGESLLKGGTRHQLAYNNSSPPVETTTTTYTSGSDSITVNVENVGSTSAVFHGPDGNVIGQSLGSIGLPVDPIVQNPVSMDENPRIKAAITDVDTLVPVLTLYGA